MHLSPIFGAALFLAAPLASQTQPKADPQIRQGKLTWFLLTENMPGVMRAMGQPKVIADFGNDYQSWQYQIGGIDGHDFSHILVFRKSSKTLVSVARNYEPERAVDALLPAAETTVHHYPDAAGPQYSIRVRRLAGGRVLMAMGTSKPGQHTGQLVLIRESELRFFYPWLLER